MKRLLVIGLTLSLFLGVVGSAQAKRGGTPREEVQEYSLPRGVGIDTDLPGVLVGMASFATGSARSVDISVEDTASPNVLVAVWEGDRMLKSFCTATDRPLRVRPGTQIEVQMYMGACEAAPSFITMGVIRATFSDR